MQELDVLGRRIQTADGDCFGVFSRRWKVKGPDAARRERWHWQAQRGVVVECGVMCLSSQVRGTKQQWDEAGLHRRQGERSPTVYYEP